jgi:chromosome segregation ATPase
MSNLIDRVLHRGNGGNGAAFDQEKIAQLTDAARDESQHLGELMKAVDTKVVGLAHVDDTVRTIHEKIVKAEAKLEKFEQRLGDTKAVEKKLSELETRSESIESLAEETNARICAVTERSEEVDKASALMAELIELSDPAEKKIEAFSKQADALTKLGQKLETLGKQTLRCDEHFDDLKVDYVELRSLISSLSQESARMGETGTLLRSEVEGAMKKASELEGKMRLAHDGTRASQKHRRPDPHPQRAHRAHLTKSEISGGDPSDRGARDERVEEARPARLGDGQTRETNRRG